MVEVQKHGFGFEGWLFTQIFNGYVADSYGQKWDVGVEGSLVSELPPDMRGLPVSVKTCKWGAPINLGDAPRQMKVDSDFVMIAGFWRQTSKTEKTFGAIRAARFKVGDWANLWRSYKLEDVQLLDDQIKDMKISYLRAREIAKAWARTRKPVDGSCLRINPKIDSKTQRRLQCSLPFNSFWKHIGEEPVFEDSQRFCGKLFPNPMSSSPRTFNH